MKRAVSIFLLLPVAVLAADANALPNLIPAYGELPVSFWEQHHLAIITCSLAILVIVGLLLIVSFRPKPAVVVTPETLARLALEKLQGRPEDGKTLSEISQILRRYLCAEFGTPSTGMATAEFSAALAANPEVGVDFAKKIAAFLSACDKDKFSPKVIAPPLDAVKRALELIEITGKRHAPEVAP